MVLFFVAVALAPPSAGYPQTINSFADGTQASLVTFDGSSPRQYVGTLRLPSNGTVTGATLQVEAALAPSTLFLVDGIGSGFQSAQLATNVSVGSGGLSLALVNGSTEFSGSALDGGVYFGTAREGNDVILSNTNGSYWTPPIGYGRTSYGRLIARGWTPPGTDLSFDVLSSAGAILQVDIRPGELVLVDSQANPAIRIAARLSGIAAGVTPHVSNLGVGFSLGDGLLGTAANAQTTNLRAVADALELETRPGPFSTPFGAPVIAPRASTWYSNEVRPRSAIVVGSQIWLYAAGDTMTGSGSVGRFVSNDGGATWSGDASPLLTPSSAGWDRQSLDHPVVLWDGGSDWRMWYTGFDVSGWEVGSQIGYATSPDGVNWTKSASNPVLGRSVSGWDNQMTYVGGVVKEGSTLFMSYTARSSTSSNSAVGIATSTDGVNWTRFAGNPIITRSTANYTNSEAFAGNFYRWGGQFYLFWLCQVNTGGPYNRECLSTSADGFNFAHDPGNPILVPNSTAWDANAAYGLTTTYNPMTGEPLWFFQGGRYGPDYIAVGRGFPARVPVGAVSMTWDTAGEVPSRIDRVEVVTMQPPSTGVSANLSAGPATTSMSVNETVALYDTSITTPANRMVRLAINATSAAANDTPRILSARIDYSRFVGQGVFVTRATHLSTPVQSASLTFSGSLPPQTSLDLELTNDHGATWWPTPFGQPVTFADAGSDFQYRLTFHGSSAASPLVTATNATLTVMMLPTDLRVESASGVELARVQGQLPPSTLISLSAAALNEFILPFAAQDPPVGVYVDVFATSSTAGQARFSVPLVAMTFPDALVASFGPMGSAIEIVNGSAQWLEVRASTTPGVTVSYSWILDGGALPETGAALLYRANQAGDFEVQVTVSNGQFQVEHTWSISVVEPPVAVSAMFFPSPGSFTVLANSSSRFVVSLAPATTVGTYEWRLNGAIVGDEPTFDFIAPVTSGPYRLQVTASAAGSSFEAEWALVVIAPPPPPPRGNTGQTEQAGTGSLIWILGTVAGAAATVTFAALFLRERRRPRAPP